jgi:cytochrome c oxidase subunit 2
MKKLFLFALLMAIFAIVPEIAVAAEGKVHAPHAWGWFFQTDDSELGNRMIDFHNYVFAIIAVITAIVIGLMIYICIKFRRREGVAPSKTTHNTMLEVVWTIIPILIVIAIIVPSIKLLYYVDRVEDADFTLKVVGYQWYWGYELPEFGVEEFESRIIPEKDLKEGDLRLLEVDEPLLLPVGKTVRVLVTGDPNGVIHSWGVPALKFKRDTVPGRVNEGWIKIEKAGVYYGQCYELCGPEHAYMPIKILGVPEAEFNDWVTKKGGTVPGLQAVAEIEVETKEINKEGI